MKTPQQIKNEVEKKTEIKRTMTKSGYIYLAIGITISLLSMLLEFKPSFYAGFVLIGLGIGEYLWGNSND